MSSVARAAGCIECILEALPHVAAVVRSVRYADHLEERAVVPFEPMHEHVRDRMLAEIGRRVSEAIRSCAVRGLGGSGRIGYLRAAKASVHLSWSDSDSACQGNDTGSSAGSPRATRAAAGP